MDINNLKILIGEYDRMITAKLTNEALLEALKNLDPQTVIDKKEGMVMAGMPIAKTAGDRIKEVEDELKIWPERVKAVKEAIKKEVLKDENSGN